MRLSEIKEARSIPIKGFERDEEQKNVPPELKKGDRISAKQVPENHTFVIRKGECFYIIDEKIAKTIIV